VGQVGERKVVFVLNRLAPGGAERAVLLLCRYLPAQRWRPAVICLQEPGQWADRLGDEVELVTGIIGYKYDPRIPIRLSRALTSLRADVVVTVGSAGDRMFWSIIAGKWLDLPVVVWSHHFPRRDDFGVERCNLVVAPLAAGFVALSAQHRDALGQVYGVPIDRIEVVHNGIEVPAEPREHLRSRARHLLGLSEDEVVVGMVANLRPEKGIDIFLELARRLGDAGTVRFVLVGDGPSRGAVERFLCETGSDRFFVWTGHRDDADEIVYAFDIAVLTSTCEEGLSLFMLEAMAAGCAFVAPSGGALGAALREGITGLRAVRGSVDSFADAVRLLISDRPLREGLGRNAASLARREFTAERMAANFARVLRKFRGF